MARIMVGLSLALLGGCVSYNTTLSNKDGKTLICGGWAFGWATPIEMAMHHDCMQKAHAAGYYEAGAIPTAQQ